MKKMYSFSSNIIQKTHKKYKINVKVLLTWGASMGGMILPLDNFIRDKNYNLDDYQISLILVGIACTYFYDNKNMLGSIVSKIKEEGLYDIFKQVKKKSGLLKNAFVKFMESLNITLSSMVDTLSYAFLIPIVTDIQSMSQHSENITSTSELIAERLIASGVVIVGGTVLVKVLEEVIKRLK
jgi:hypothetical protein